MCDAVCFVFLICAVCAVMLYSFNKMGYAFTAVDGLVLSLLGVVAFIVPYGIVQLIVSIMR